MIRTLLGRGSLYTTATAVQLSASVVVLPFLTRLLPPEQMGEVALAVVVMWLLGILAGAGLPTSLSRVWFKGDEGPERSRFLLRRCLLIAVLTAAVADVTGPAWSQVFSEVGYDLTLRLAVWAAVPLAVLTCSQTLLRAADRAGRFVVTAVVASAPAQVLGLALIAATTLESSGYILGLLIGQTAAACLGALWVGIASPARIDSEGVTRSALRVGLPTIPHSFAIYVLAFGDRAVVKGLLGAGAVGRYQVAYAIGTLVLSLLYAFGGAWRPIIFGEREDRRWVTLAETRAVLYGLSGTVAAALAIGAPLALVIAAPDTYDPYGLVGVTAIVALSAVPMVSYQASVQVLIWEGHTGIMAWSTPLVAAANIGLVFALIPPLGLEGAAAATACAYALLALVTYLAARRFAHVPGGLRPLIVATVWAGAGTAASLMMPSDGTWLTIRTVAALGLGVIVVRQIVSHWRAGDMRGSPPEGTEPALYGSSG